MSSCFGRVREAPRTHLWEIGELRERAWRPAHDIGKAAPDDRERLESNLFAERPQNSASAQSATHQNFHSPSAHSELTTGTPSSG